MKEHTLEINLDEPGASTGFCAMYGTTQGRRLANLLGLSGKGSSKAATALSCYAWNKHTAEKLRLAGNIAKALEYEAICDRIYATEILGKILCW